MKSLQNKPHHDLVRFHWLITALLIAFLLLATVTWHFTVNAAPTLSDLNDQGQISTTTGTSLNPFIDVVPSQDGTELYISAQDSDVLSGTVFANIGIGPGHQEGSYTMSYSNTVQTYIAMAAGFTPGTDASGPLSISTTSGLNSGTVAFNRAFIPASTTTSIHSIDGFLQLSVVSTDTFNTDTYITVVPSYGLSDALPLGHMLVGSSYSVRAPATTLNTTRPMSLRIYYDETILAGTDPHTLAIFAWDASNKQWDNLGGRLFYNQKYLSVATSRFTTFALLATTTWRDEFDDFNEFDTIDNITLALEDGDFSLIMANTPGIGTAVSKPITPNGTIESWGTLTFTYATDPPTTTLTIDVLSLEGTELQTNLTAGSSLMAIDPVQHPSLKLRANLTSTETSFTPYLDQWQLTWQVEMENKVYLPMVQR